MTNRFAFILLIMLIACALGAISSQHKARKLYVELQQELSTAKQLDVEWGQLRLEQGTWATHGRVERVAKRELKMRLPPAGRIEVVQLPRPETVR